MRAAVLGTGIAGLSVAEILSRNGYAVTLFDVNPYLGGDASLSTQNWHHTGWLYAAMDSPEPAHGCARALWLMPRMYDDAPRWVRPGNPVWYLYAVRGGELVQRQREDFIGIVRDRALARMTEFGQGSIPEPEDPRLTPLMERWDRADAYWPVLSTDSELDTMAVLTGLAERIECEAVELGREPQVTHRESIGVDGDTYVDGAFFDLVVLAAGSGIEPMLRRLGRFRLANMMRSVVSPIAVLREPLDLPNFIRYTPEVEHTINHMRFRTSQGIRSTIGAQDSWPLHDWRPPGAFVAKVCKRMGLEQDAVDHVYYAVKTEYGAVANDEDRRYNHAVVRVNDNTLMVVPGKFSQFPLLAYDVAQHLGLEVMVPMLPPRPAPARMGQLRALQT